MAISGSSSEQSPSSRQGEAELVNRILDLVRGVRFGSVEIVIHDSRVVQIERREKLRLDFERSR